MRPQEPRWEHVPVYPRGFIIVRWLQCLVCIVSLLVNLFLLGYLELTIFKVSLAITIASTIINIWMVVASSCAPLVYNYWAVLAADIVLFIGWLVVVVGLAVVAGSVAVSPDNPLISASTAQAARTLCYVALAIVGSQCLLFAISLTTHSIVTHRLRQTKSHKAAVYKHQGGQTGEVSYAAVPQDGIHHIQETFYEPYKPAGYPQGSSSASARSPPPGTPTQGRNQVPLRHLPPV